ncbi:hypothetical protein PGB90_001492 [Kerria lacca]
MVGACHFKYIILYGITKFCKRKRYVTIKYFLSLNLYSVSSSSGALPFIARWRSPSLHSPMQFTLLRHPENGPCIRDSRPLTYTCQIRTQFGFMVS